MHLQNDLAPRREADAEAGGHPQHVRVPRPAGEKPCTRDAARSVAGVTRTVVGAVERVGGGFGLRRVERIQRDLFDRSRIGGHDTKRAHQRVVREVRIGDEASVRVGTEARFEGRFRVHDCAGRPEMRLAGSMQGRRTRRAGVGLFGPFQEARGRRARCDRGRYCRRPTAAFPAARRRA